MNFVASSYDVTFSLPKLISVDDYHEFKYLEFLFKNIISDKVVISEVGFDGKYIGLVHTNKKSDLELVGTMSKYYEDPA